VGAGSAPNGRAQCEVSLAGTRTAHLWPGANIPALSETAEYLESLVEQTLAMMNQGARLADTVSAVQVPAHLVSARFCNPSTTNPSSSCATSGDSTAAGGTATRQLRPANDRALALELAELAGGPRHWLRAPKSSRRRFRGVSSTGGHLAELAWLGRPAMKACRPFANRCFVPWRARHLDHVARRLSLGRTRDHRRAF